MGILQQQGPHTKCLPPTCQPGAAENTVGVRVCCQSLGRTSCAPNTPVENQGDMETGTPKHKGCGTSLSLALRYLINTSSFCFLHIPINLSQANHCPPSIWWLNGIRFHQTYVNSVAEILEGLSVWLKIVWNNLYTWILDVLFVFFESSNWK